MIKNMQDVDTILLYLLNQNDITISKKIYLTFDSCFYVKEKKGEVKKVSNSQMRKLIWKDRKAINKVYHRQYVTAKSKYINSIKEGLATPISECSDKIDWTKGEQNEN